MFWVAADLKEGFFFTLIETLIETLYTDDIRSSYSYMGRIET